MTPAEAILAKTLLPTELDSAEIREQWSADIRRRAFFSATVSEAGYLERLRDICSQVATGEMDNATARMLLQQKLDEINYVPEKMDMSSLSAPRRIALQLDTNRKIAHSAALVERQTPMELHMSPAWRLVRSGTRRVPRQDWHIRWQSAGESVGWQGASRDDFTALKDSPIWQALGNGEGGFRDTLGNPYPPFAFGSGMDWQSVPREECIRLGLIDADSEAKKPKGGLAPRDETVKQAVEGMSADMKAKLLAELEDF